MQYRAEHGLTEATVTSARALDDRALNDVKTILKTLHRAERTPVIDAIIQPDVIGGVRISLPHEQLDDTVRAQLNRFKQRIKVDG